MYYQVLFFSNLNDNKNLAVTSYSKDETPNSKPDPLS